VNTGLTYPGGIVGSGGRGSGGDAYVDGAAVGGAGNDPIQISFYNNIQSITSHDKATYDPPHWSLTSNPNKNYPVAYVSMDNVELSATFASPYSAGRSICGLGKLTDAITGEEKLICFDWQWAIPVGQTLGGYVFEYPRIAARGFIDSTAPGARFSFPIPSPFALGEARYYQPLEIHWYSSLFGWHCPPQLPTFGDMNCTPRTYHTMYVTCRYPSTPEREWMVFHLSCFAGSGQSDPNTIVDNIWDIFKTRQVTRCTGGAYLTYHALQDDPDTTAGLLGPAGDGMCRAWGLFMRDCIKIQGIPSKKIGIQPLGKPSSDVEDQLPEAKRQWDPPGGFYIKHWVWDQVLRKPLQGTGLPVQGGGYDPWM